VIAVATVLALVVAVPMAGLALNLRNVAATAVTCTNSLAGSTFEIDPDANLKVDTSGCIDWLTGGAGTGFRSGVLAKNDKASGSSDNVFGQGTSEDSPNPTIVDGSIPPNKSDLKAFGIYTEAGTPSTANPTGKFLELFWSRVQNPSGTINMDFELNQKFCDPNNPTPATCANNGNNLQPGDGRTPVRTTGDKLITYDLSKGGTVPTISIRTWNGSASGPATVISGGQNSTALGSINSSLIPANQTGGATGGLTTALGSQDPYTFGEAAVSFGALFGNNATCGKFGSAYLKSRSSDSFSAEVKDFVAPEQVSISNCSTLTTSVTKSVTIGNPINDTATLSNVTATAGGSITFKAFSDSNCSTLKFTSNAIPVSGPGNYTSNNFTPTAVGTYYWTVSYTGDASNQGFSTSCGDANESSVVGPASPSINTTPNPSSGTVGDTLKDSAALSGGYSPTGNIVFKLFAPNDPNCSVTPVFTETVSVSNGNGTYNTANGYKATDADTYHWTADYTSGNANNNDTSSGCTTETVVVGKAQPSIGTTLSSSSITVGGSVHDSATLSGATANAGGTVTYTVYTNNTCTTGARDGGTVTVANGAVPDSNGLQFNTPGDYSWQAVYSGDDHNQGATSTCTDEHLVVGKASTNISTAQQLRPQDSASLSAGAGGPPTGMVDFYLYGPNNPTCDAGGANPVYKETGVTLTNGSASTSNSTFSVTSANSDQYHWKAVYGGDSTHYPVTSNCTENFTLTIAN
jgi:hypothetical protein